MCIQVLYFGTHTREFNHSKKRVISLSRPNLNKDKNSVNKPRSSHTNCIR